MRTQCCCPPIGSPPCPDCPLTVPFYATDRGHGFGGMLETVGPPSAQPFVPTHRHAEGGTYQEIGPVSIHVGSEAWVDGVLYRNEDGTMFARPKKSFHRRFEKIE